MCLPLHPSVADTFLQRRYFYFCFFHCAVVSGCFCCPPNILRFVASVARLLYGFDDDTIYVQQYMDTKTEMDRHKAYTENQISDKRQNQGKKCNADKRFIAFRIPDWCKYNTEAEIRQSVNSFIEFYNTKRPHSVLRYRTPNAYESEYFNKTAGKSENQTEH